MKLMKNKWFIILLALSGPAVTIIYRTTGNSLPRLVFLPLLYIIVLTTRSNYFWYFCFEFVILILFSSALLIPIKYIGLSTLCIYSSVGVTTLYMIIVKIMNTRGYPVKRQEKPDKE